MVEPVRCLALPHRKCNHGYIIRVGEGREPRGGEREKYVAAAGRAGCGAPGHGLRDGPRAGREREPGCRHATASGGGAQQPVSVTPREWKAIAMAFGRANDDATELAKTLRHAVDQSNIKPAG